MVPSTCRLFRVSVSNVHIWASEAKRDASPDPDIVVVFLFDIQTIGNYDAENCESIMFILFTTYVIISLM